MIMLGAAALTLEDAMSNVRVKHEHGGKPAYRYIGFLALSFVAGCASPNGEPVSVASAVGTPFLIALKVPVCVATVAISGPAAALQQLAAPNEDGLQPDIRPALDAGIDDNCGPPYVVTPR